MKDYNFFDAYLISQKQQKNFNSPLFYFILGLVLILGTSAGLLFLNSLVSDEYAALTGELQVLYESEAYQEAEVYKQSISSITEYDQYASSALDKIESGKILGTVFLKKLTEALPTSTSLISLNATTATVNLTANVPTKSAAAELLLRMENSGLFWQISLSSAVLADETGTYTATYDGILKAGDLK